MQKKFLIALQFLTIIPVRIKTAVNESDITGSASAFIVVGIMQGLLLMTVDFIAGMVFHSDLVMGLTLFVLVVSNGGFHLDGLADTFDAIAVKSGGNPEIDRQKRLAVMKDGTIGPIGVIAIIFVLSLKYLSLKNLSNFLPFTYYSTLILLPVMPKWTMTIAMFYGRPAREDGLGRLFIGKIGFRAVAVSTLIFISILAVFHFFLGHYAPVNQYVFYAVSLIVLYVFSRASVGFFNKKFGGLSGDTLGAMSELTEITFLLMVIVWSQLST
ncbi:MAG: adenosylcobinamide-GDP ribazoletransferase [Nitrospirae bacterium]|nr:adenosylcobinamide-GDP ribazoletransferase [Nitrospirota bacterium]